MDMLIAFLMSMFIIWTSAIVLYIFYALLHLPRYYFNRHYRKN